MISDSEKNREGRAWASVDADSFQLRHRTFYSKSALTSINTIPRHTKRRSPFYCHPGKDECTDFDVGLLRLHQLVDDLAEFVGVGELSLSGGAGRGRQGRHRARGEG